MEARHPHGSNRPPRLTAGISSNENHDFADFADFSRFVTYNVISELASES